MVGLRGDETDPVAHTEFLDERSDTADFAVAFDAARAANDEEHGLVDVRESAYRDVESFERLDPAHEQQHLAIGVEAESSARPFSVAR